jgi:hypothetical protein
MAESFYKVYPRRTADEASRMRATYPQQKELGRFGYHMSQPFTVRHTVGDIHTIVAPDLLHEVSKGFYDYVHTWMFALLEKSHNASKDKVKGEIDARFSHIQPYNKLRMFRRGISKISRWTGDQYKNLLRVYIAVMRDILPNQAVKLIKVPPTVRVSRLM